MNDGKKDQYYKISKQLGVSYFFNTLIVLFQPLLIALLTRVLSVEEFGVYSLLFTTISLFAIFFRFGLFEYIKNKIPGLNEETRVRVIITLLTFSLVSVLSAGFLLYIFRGFIITSLALENYAHLWKLSIILIVFVTLVDTICSYLISIKKILALSFLQFFIKCFWIIVLFVFFFIIGPFSINQVFIIWLMAVSLSFGITIYFIKHELFYFFKYVHKFDFQRLRAALKFSLPLILVVSFTLIINSLDKYMINYFLGKTDVAMYSLAYGLVTVIITIPIIFQSVIEPYFTEKWNLKENISLFFNIMLKYSLIMVFPCITAMFVLRREIVYLISGPKYFSAIPLIAILLLFPLLATLIQIFKKMMYLRDMVQHTLLIYFIAAVVNVVFNLVFIPKIGVSAAAYSTILSYFIVFIVLLFLRPSSIRFQWDYLKPLRILIAAVLMAVLIASVGTGYHWSKILVILFGGLIYVSLLFLLKVFGKEEKGLISFIFKRFKKYSYEL